MLMVEWCIGSETPVDLVTCSLSRYFFMCANTFCKWKYVNKEDKDKTFIMFYFLIKDDYSVGIEHYLGKIQVC